MSHIHNALERATDLIRGFRRALGIVGPEGGIERFGETLTPIMNLWGHPDWSLLHGELLQWSTASIPAGGAGFRSQFMIRPVATSKLIVVVRHIECNIAFNVRTGLLSNLGTAQSTFQRDTRNPSDSRVAATSANGAAAIGTVRFQVLSAPFRLTLPIVIHTDGDGTNSGALVVDPRTDNTAIDVAVAWTAREAFPGENANA